MFDRQHGTLLTAPRHFLGCPRGKGLLKESLVEARGCAWIRRSYLILISVCLSLRHRTLGAVFRRIIPSFVHSQAAVSLDVLALWRVVSTTSRSSQPLRCAARQNLLPEYDWAGFHHFLSLLRLSELGKRRWVWPDSEAVERGLLPSVPHRDQHNTSA